MYKYFCVIISCRNFMSLVAISTEDQNEALVPQGFHFLVNTTFSATCNSFPLPCYVHLKLLIQTCLCFVYSLKMPILR